MLMRNYNISFEQYDAMLVSQDYRCLVCRNSFTKTKGGQACVDHDHITGRVRGVLCFNCNTVLGKVKDNTDTLRRAIQYLEGGDL